MAPLSLPARILTAILTFYRRFLSPLKGATCRFHPSCSQYMIDAIHTHGAPSGLGLGVKRILRCHPWHPGGYDPVPPARQNLRP